MGLSIHYSGQIRDYALIKDLINECEDICKSLEWKYYIREKKGNTNDNAHLINSDFINSA